MKNKNFPKGFTLIELLIVITIIGILAAALLPSVLNAPARARDAARVADLSKISSALETYNADNGKYPDFKGCVEAIPGLDKYFSGGKAPLDPSKLPVADCQTGGYYYCNLKGSLQTYIVAAKVERDESGNGDAADIDNLACDGTDTEPLPLTKPPKTGTGIYAIVQ